jgi:CheY-like chemotaxis protein
MIFSILSPIPSQTQTQNDPLLALSNFKPDLYGLALIDIRMPKMNGFELYKK